jgi:hypothetical protein
MNSKNFLYEQRKILLLLSVTTKVFTEKAVQWLTKLYSKEELNDRNNSSHILDSLKNLVTRPEMLGFDSFWVMDHFHQIPRSPLNGDSSIYSSSSSRFLVDILSANAGIVEFAPLGSIT